MVPAHHKLLLRRDAGIAGEVSDQAVAEAQDEPSRRPDVGGKAARREELRLVLFEKSGRQSVGVRGRTPATTTFPTDVVAPKRTKRTSLAGSPPSDFTFAEKKKCISPPTIRGACLASTTFTVFELGASLTDTSGFEQLPALAEGWCESPIWSPWTWLRSTASILPSRGSLPPRTVRPTS